jgi:hypothetical protein
MRKSERKGEIGIAEIEGRKTPISKWKRILGRERERESEREESRLSNGFQRIVIMISFDDAGGEADGEKVEEVKW